MRILNFSLSQTFAVSQAKVPEALPMRQLTSVSKDTFDEILEPRYTKFFTLSISLPSILIDDGTYVPYLRTFVFFKLMVRKIVCKRDLKYLNVGTNK